MCMLLCSCSSSSSSSSSCCCSSSYCCKCSCSTFWAVSLNSGCCLMDLVMDYCYFSPVKNFLIDWLIDWLVIFYVFVLLTVRDCRQLRTTQNLMMNLLSQVSPRTPLWNHLLAKVLILICLCLFMWQVETCWVSPVNPVFCTSSDLTIVLHFDPFFNVVDPFSSWPVSCSHAWLRVMCIGWLCF